MTGLLSDENFEGHAERLMARVLSEEWRDVWDDYRFRYVRFADSGLGAGAKDTAVYRYCQEERLVLLTANRNNDGPESLEAAIRSGVGTALPVVTIADSDRILTDGRYASVVADLLIEVLSDIVDRPESILGTGRVYLPRKPIPS